MICSTVGRITNSIAQAIVFGYFNLLSKLYFTFLLKYNRLVIRLIESHLPFYILPKMPDIPLYAIDRTEEDPIVIGGGPCAYNPEPIADFFDFFYLGEAETVYRKLMDLYKKNKAANSSKWE